ncbi:MAG: response regulator [Candidatus Nomurabacteria bacterium]|nr:response regulator [Candidatus Nomurabacteria bacterium]
MSKTILVIEDDSFLRELEHKKLTEKGYTVFSAENSAQAFEILNGATKVDLVLLDLLLPEVDGFTILKEIRDNKNLSGTPVIIFSNLYEEKDAKQANKLGITDYMLKSNFTLDELAEKVKKFIGE